MKKVARFLSIFSFMVAILCVAMIVAGIVTNQNPTSIILFVVNSMIFSIWGVSWYEFAKEN